MNAKTSMFVICVEAIIYLLLCNLHDCTFKTLKQHYIFPASIKTFSKFKAKTMESSINFVRIKLCLKVNKKDGLTP